MSSITDLFRPLFAAGSSPVLRCYDKRMMRVDARMIRPAFGGGFVIQTEEMQQYFTGRQSEWNGRSWMGYPSDQNDRIILHLPAVEVFPVYNAGRVMGYAFYDSVKEWEQGA